MNIVPAKWLEDELERLKMQTPKKRLLLHACCAPCSSYVLEYLSRYLDITLYFYNPNISPAQEYDFRARELISLVERMPLGGKVDVLRETYDPTAFLHAVQGREAEAEGGQRCRICYRLRLEAAAACAAKGGYDYFTTTLSISLYKNAAWLNEIGGEMAQQYGVPYLYSDFKKKNGYKRSCELSALYGLYRQDYCGCEFSRLAAQKRAEERAGR